MKVTYLCPHCRGVINAENSIILSAKTKTKKVGLVLLHEEIGNYSSILSDSLTIKKGEVVDVFCPICHESLNIPDKDFLAKFIRIDDSCNECYIIISRKYGENITFKVDNNKHIETYGEKLSRFIDPAWYL
jgi:hypothetical protein